MQRFNQILKLLFYFSLGAVSTGLILISISYLTFSFIFKDKIYPGVKTAGLDLGGQTRQQVESSLTSLSYSHNLSTLELQLVHPQASVSATASQLQLRLDTDLMAKRAFSVGRQTRNPYYNFLQIFAAWQGRIDLPVEYVLNQEILNAKINTISPLIEKDPVDAVFKFTPQAGPDQKGRVVAFIPSQNGLSIDREKTKEKIIEGVTDNFTGPLKIPIVTKVVLPNIQTTTADEMGIKNLLGRGESYFYDSIPGRVYNLKLGTEKISGSLIAPDEIFSFDHAIGTVSAVFGFQKAYAIVKGKTVLDDGGGVCQVSTTLYRAILNAGLPVVERTAHSYRVGFYEQGKFMPGLDATVYPPSPDLKFKNDTGSTILIQTAFDPENSKLTFELFGTNDGRKTEINGPYILSTSPPPEPIYEDDPTLPVGQTKQVDTAHYGARVYFKRLVTRGTETLIDETVWSDYIPWPARYLRGTKT